MNDSERYYRWARSATSIYLLSIAIWCRITASHRQLMATCPIVLCDINVPPCTVIGCIERLDRPGPYSSISRRSHHIAFSVRSWTNACILIDHISNVYNFVYFIHSTTLFIDMSKLLKSGRYICMECGGGCITSVLQCDVCKTWTHFECQQLSKADVKHFEGSGIQFVCFDCRSLRSNSLRTFDYVSALRRLRIAAESPRSAFKKVADAATSESIYLRRVELEVSVIRYWFLYS